MADETTPTSDAQPEGAVQDGGRTMLVRVDERNMNTSYANAYRTHQTPEEVMIDFGVNMVTQAPPAAQQQAKEKVDGQILFQINNRTIVNYFTAKRLAISLGQIVRMYEDAHGEIKIDSGKKK